MKLSVIMPHYKRAKLLNNTLKAYRQLHTEAFLKEVEFVIIDDNGNRDVEFWKVINKHKQHLNILAASIDEGTHNPVIPYNYGIRQARGDIIILTQPECIPMVNNLLEAIYQKTGDTYLSCACYALTKRETLNIRFGSISKIHDRAANFKGDSGWCNHSVYCPRDLNFMTAIKRKTLIELGGFDEDYAYGFWYDDDDIRDRIVRAGYKIRPADDIVCFHQYHYDETFHTQDDIKRNKQIYESKKNGPTVSNQGKEWGKPKKRIYYEP